MIQIERRHFGVLIPSTNTTVEIEYTHQLPATLQFHTARLGKGGNTPFSPSRDEDVIYQSKMLGHARVEVVALAQTSASLFDDGYDAKVKMLMSQNAGVPAVTSAEAIGEAVLALGAKRIGIVTPYSTQVIEMAKRYYERKYGLQVVGMEGFGATDAYAIGKLDANTAFDGFAPCRHARDRGADRSGWQFPDHALDRGVGACVRQAGDHDQSGRPMGRAWRHEAQRSVAWAWAVAGADAALTAGLSSRTIEAPLSRLPHRDLTPAMTQQIHNASGLRRLLATPAFLRLWAIGGCVNTMRFFELLSAALFTLDVTGSGLAVALVSAARTMPMLLFGAFSGVVTEAVSRKLVLQIGQLLTCAVRRHHRHAGVAGPRAAMASGGFIVRFRHGVVDRDGDAPPHGR